jgi:tRNA A37 methylthiotransferase MiaB
MRRPANDAKVLQRIRSWREQVPDLAIRSSFVVGFPGETEEDFRPTLEVVEEVGYDRAFTCVYSPRAGTEAASMPDQVPHEVKIERMERLVEVVQRGARARNAARIGRVEEVLVEGTSRTDESLLRRMRRFGGREAFLGLLDDVRRRLPHAGIRSNVIVGFPGETEDDLATLCDFLVAARMDVVGVFGYSDEDGTEAASYDGKLDEDEIRGRVEHLTDLVEQLTAERAEERIGEEVVVLVESVDADEEGAYAEGRADHQGPEVDGTTRLTGGTHAVGDWVRARVVAAEGADLVAEPVA